MIDISKAKVNKRIPKNRFKVAFTNLDTIIWLYKISPDTADIRQSEEMLEFQIFSVLFKDGNINKRDLTLVQKAIPYPILFCVDNLSRDEQSYFMMIGDTLFESDKQFLDEDTLTIEQSCLKIKDLYDNIARVFIQLQQRSSENITQLAERSLRQQELEKQIKVLERKMNAEKQFDRQIEINAEIKKFKMELEET